MKGGVKSKVWKGFLLELIDYLLYGGEVIKKFWNNTNISAWSIVSACDRRESSFPDQGQPTIPTYHLE